MGPHFFKCGKRSGLKKEDNEVAASMGPHFFKCGKTRLRDELIFRPDGFNGAALFQVRKNLLITSFLSLIVPLQWGRTFSSAENRPGTIVPVTRVMLQWGRTFSSAENKTESYIMEKLRLLQWGRTFSSAENRKIKMRKRRRRQASMGPHFFKCGKR